MTEELTRRSALRGAGVFAVGGVAGAVVTTLRDEDGDNPNANAYGDPDTSAGSGSALAAVDDIPSGGGLVLDDAKIVLTKADDGTVHAFSSICTHQGCPVNEVTDGRIICPCHGSEFDAGTGEVTEGPASQPLPSVAVAVRDGEVFPA
ncbi:Rieske (2Fe-2S) protein [Nocardioides dilutus]